MSLLYRLLNVYERFGGDSTKLPQGIKHRILAKEIESADSSYMPWQKALAFSTLGVFVGAGVPAIVQAQEKPSEKQQQVSEDKKSGDLGLHNYIFGVNGRSYSQGNLSQDQAVVRLAKDGFYYTITDRIGREITGGFVEYERAARIIKSHSQQSEREKYESEILKQLLGKLPERVIAQIKSEKKDPSKSLLTLDDIVKKQYKPILNLGIAGGNQDDKLKLGINSEALVPVYQGIFEGNNLVGLQFTGSYAKAENGSDTLEGAVGIVLNSAVDNKSMAQFAVLYQHRHDFNGNLDFGVLGGTAAYKKGNTTLSFYAGIPVTGRQRTNSQDQSEETQSSATIRGNTITTTTRVDTNLRGYVEARKVLSLTLEHDLSDSGYAALENLKLRGGAVWYSGIDGRVKEGDNTREIREGVPYELKAVLGLTKILDAISRLLDRRTEFDVEARVGQGNPEFFGGLKIYFGQSYVEYIEQKAKNLIDLLTFAKVERIELVKYRVTKETTRKSPTIDSTCPTEGREGIDYVCDIKADGTEFSLVQGPPFLKLVKIGEHAARYSGTPGLGAAGDYKVIIMARKPDNLPTFLEYPLAIAAAPSPEPSPSPPPPPPPPTEITLDVKVNGSDGPISVNNGSNVNITWATTGNPTSCNASGDWSGPKNPAGGSELTGILSGPSTKTYNMNCTKGTNSISDIAVVNVSLPPPSLQASCSGSPNPADIGALVTWIATVSGGTGSYTHNWSGTDGLSGTTPSVTKSYSTSGIKQATDIVTSGTESKTANCQVTVNAPINHPPTVTMVSPASDISILVGGSVSFSATGTDPDGDPLTYSWMTTTVVGSCPTIPNVQNPGSVQYNNAAICDVKVSDNDGRGGTATSPTRRITVNLPPPPP